MSNIEILKVVNTESLTQVQKSYEVLKVGVRGIQGPAGADGADASGAFTATAEYLSGAIDTNSANIAALSASSTDFSSLIGGNQIDVTVGGASATIDHAEIPLAPGSPPAGDGPYALQSVGLSNGHVTNTSFYRFGTAADADALSFGTSGQVAALSAAIDAINPSISAYDVIYDPATDADWGFSGVPSDVGTALDNLAAEVAGLPGPGPTTYDGLTDTPSDKIGSDGKFIKVSGPSHVYSDISGSEIIYAPVNAANWSFAAGTPSDVADALDDVAAEITSLAGSSIVTFDGLTDTPANKSGSDGYAVVVSGANLVYSNTFQTQIDAIPVADIFRSEVASISAGLDGRITSIESDYLVSSDITGFAAQTTVDIISGDLNSLEVDVVNISGQVLSNDGDISYLSGAIDGIPTADIFRSEVAAVSADLAGDIATNASNISSKRTGFVAAAGYDFNGEDSASSWTGSATTFVDSVSGAIYTASGADSYIFRGLSNVDLYANPIFRLHYNNNSGSSTSCQLYVNVGSGLTLVTPFSISSVSGWKTLELDLTNNATWKGTANQIRLDLDQGGSFGNPLLIGGVSVGHTADETIIKNYTTSFSYADISGSGFLNVQHNLGKKFNNVTFSDNNNEQVIPDDIVFSSTSNLSADFTTYGTITGTWNVEVI